LTLPDSISSAYNFDIVGEINSMGSVFNCGRFPNKGLVIFRIEMINNMHIFPF